MAVAETFGAVLRRHRLAVGLTQERLAEAARVSAAGVAALEAGRSRFPRLTTVSLLADALGLEGADRAALVAAASPGLSSTTPTAGTESAAVAPAAVASAPPALAAPPPAPALFGPVGGWRHAFVGRRAPLQRLASEWAKRTRVVVLSGEAGIGKTRLADQFSRAIHDDGATVLWGRWTEERLGAYAGFVEPVRQAAARLRPEGLDGLHHLGRLVPELWAGQLGPAAVHADGEVERRLLFEAIAALIRRCGATLLVLDDLHWADSASLALLGYLASAPALTDLVMLGTARRSDLGPLTAGVLADLGRASTVETVTLGRLERADVDHLVRAAVGPEASPDLVERVAVACEGNAFFAEELAAHLAGLADAAVTADDVAVPLPDRIRAVLSKRLAGLPEPSRALLRAGAVMGREFDPWIAGEVADLDGSALIAATEDVLLSGLAEETVGGQLSFSHALVQAAVDAQLSSVRRVYLHRRAALALEHSGRSDAAVVAGIARHWAAVADVDRSAIAFAASWAVRAGDAALAAAGTEEAIAQYEKANRLLAANTAEHADTLIRLGIALSSSGRPGDADEQFRSALRLADGLGDSQLLARAALGLSRTLVFGRTDQERIDALRLALDRLPAADEILRPAATLMLLRQFSFVRTDETMPLRRHLQAEVIAAMDKPNLPAELLLMVGAAHDTIPLPEPHSLDRLSRQVRAVAADRGELSVLTNGWRMGAWSAFERADRLGWDRCVAEYEDLAEQLALPRQRSEAASLRACEAQIEGRSEDASTLAAEAVARARDAGDDAAEIVYLGRAVLLSFDTGQSAAMLPAMAALADDYRDISTFRSGLCLTAALAGDVDLARRLLADQAAIGFHAIPPDVEWAAAIAFYSHACVVVGEASYAADLYDVMAQSTAVAVRVGPLVGWWGPVDYHRGALCRMLGRLDEARQRLQHAIDVSKAMGAAPFLARSQLELAQVLELCRGLENDQQATALRRQAGRG